MYEQEGDFYDDIEDEEEDADDDVMDLDAEPTVCIFSGKTFEGCQNMWDHCAAEYGFSLSIFKQYGPIDCITYIKVINYIRKEVRSLDI